MPHSAAIAWTGVSLSRKSRQAAAGSIWGGKNRTRFDFDFFSVHVDYGANGPAMKDGRPTVMHVPVTFINANFLDGFPL
ncbi:MAG: hypothetical protein ACFUZC_23595 [Chthoniobacteraceae bacterium]